MSFLDEKIGTKKMTELACQHTAQKIYELLNNPDYQITANGGKRRIMPEDIAILVDKHTKAEDIKEELKKWNIPVTIQATGNIFATEEARDMQILLAALKNPRDLKAIKALLSTKLFDVDCQKLLEFSEVENRDLQE